MKKTHIFTTILLTIWLVVPTVIICPPAFAGADCHTDPDNKDSGAAPASTTGSEQRQTGPESSGDNSGDISGPQPPAPNSTGVLDIKLLMELNADSLTIAPGGSVTLTVTGGTGDYTWSTSGGDYTFLAGTTTQGSEEVAGWEATTNTANTLAAGACATGAVTVTVTDADNQTSSLTIENDAVASWTLVNTFTVTPVYDDEALVKTEITGLNAVWVTDGNGNKLYREEVGDNYKVQEYYDVGVTTSLDCDPFWGVGGYGTCSSLCDNSPMPVCDFWLLGNSCVTYFEGEATSNDYKFPCCDKQCLIIQERYVYQKTCQ